MITRSRFYPISTISKSSFTFLYHAFRQYMWFKRISAQTNDKKANEQSCHWARVFGNTCDSIKIFDVELLWHFYNMRPDLDYLDYYKKVKA